MGGACSTYGEGRGVYRVLVGKPEGKRPLGRPELGWEDNIKIDLQEVRCGCKDWVCLAQDRDRWRSLVNVKFGMKTNHEHTSAISIKYYLQVNKMYDNLRSLLRLIERHCEGCGPQRVQPTDEVIERRIGKELD